MNLFCLTVGELTAPSMSDFLWGLENSGWLKHIKAVLDAGVFIAKARLFTDDFKSCALLSQVIRKDMGKSWKFIDNTCLKNVSLLRQVENLSISTI